jgi:hypothetical protein
VTTSGTVGSEFSHGTPRWQWARALDVDVERSDERKSDGCGRGGTVIDDVHRHCRRAAIAPVVVTAMSGKLENRPSVLRIPVKTWARTRGTRTTRRHAQSTRSSDLSDETACRVRPSRGRGTPPMPRDPQRGGWWGPCCRGCRCRGRPRRSHSPRGCSCSGAMTTCGTPPQASMVVINLLDCSASKAS